MYYRYFGLREAPFSIAVNPGYLFMSARHRDALAHLLYGVGAGGGFILLTGEVGTGKTTINRCLLQQIPTETDIAIILNPTLNAAELLASACDELGIDYARDQTSMKDLTDKLHAFLLQNHSRGRNTVLLIDEAQHLQFDVLEQIRLLTNLETNTRKLLQIILIGQPELSSLLAKPELRQLSQRITARYNLQALNLAETHGYIRHRLQVAGWPANQELFSPAVVKAIYRHSRGIPRLINMLCDRMLLGSYGRNSRRPDRAVLKQAVAEVLGEQGLAAPARFSVQLWGWAAAAALSLALVAALWYGSLRPDGPVATAAPTADAATPGADAAGRAPWLIGQQGALERLAAYLGVPIQAAVAVCPQLPALGWRCESLNAAGWDKLLVTNRPAVLALLTPARFAAYAVLVGIDGDKGLLLSGTARQAVPLREIGPLWRGQYTLLWQPPAAYAGPISIGDRGPLVAWLAQEFAALDGQTQALAGEQFNAALDARVRLFQRRYNLRDDGVVGVKTLLQFNAVRGQGIALRPAGQPGE